MGWREWRTAILLVQLSYHTLTGKEVLTGKSQNSILENIHEHPHMHGHARMRIHTETHNTHTHTPHEEWLYMELWSAASSCDAAATANNQSSHFSPGSGLAVHPLTTLLLKCQKMTS